MAGYNWSSSAEAAEAVAALETTAEVVETAAGTIDTAAGAVEIAAEAVIRPASFPSAYTSSKHI